MVKTLIKDNVRFEFFENTLTKFIRGDIITWSFTGKVKAMPDSPYGIKNYGIRAISSINHTGYQTVDMTICDELAQFCELT